MLIRLSIFLFFALKSNAAVNALEIPKTSSQCPPSYNGSISGSACSQEYTLCVNGIQHTAVCQEGFVFYENSCVTIEKLPECQTSEKSTDTGYKSQPKTLYDVRHRVFDCSSKKDGTYRHGCSGVFFKCLWGHSYPCMCPSNLVYNAEYNRCLISCNAVPPQIEIPTSTETTPSADEVLEISLSEVIPISSSAFNTTYELEKIAKSCLTSDDHDALYKKKYYARIGDYRIIETAERLIANQEMRNILGLSPFTGLYKYPTEKEVEIANNLPEKLNATNFVKYFETTTNLDIGTMIHFFTLCQNDLIPATQYFDENYPAIRQIFRLKFEQFLRKSKMNRKKTKTIIDNLFVEYRKIFGEVTIATKKMYENTECSTDGVPGYILGRILMRAFGRGKSCN